MLMEFGRVKIRDTALWIVIPLFLISCEFISTGKNFSYFVHVQREDTGLDIEKASVTIQVGGQAPLDGVTDSRGIARIFIGDNYHGQPGLLIISASNYEPYTQNIDLFEDQLPDLIQLKPKPGIGSTPTGIVTPTALSGSTPTTIEPTLEPSPSPVNEGTVEPVTITILVQAIDTSAGVSKASVTFNVNGESLLFNSDSFGNVSVSLPSEHIGKSGELIVKAEGYLDYIETVDLVKGSLPKIISLKPTANVPTWTPAPSIGGSLTIPVKLGVEFKVYVTGFDGAGINGPNPVSLGHARQPMFRRDGQAIVVNGTSGSFNGLFVTNITGQSPLVINDSAEAYWPVWSPNGSEIIFADINQGNRLFRQSSSGLSASPVSIEIRANNIPVSAKNILWSSDNRLVFQGCADWLSQSAQCGIWVADADFLKLFRVVDQIDFPMDAKNGLLTYMSNSDGDWDIYLVPLDGGQPQNLSNNNGYHDGMAAIAPDGKSVAYISNEAGTWSLWTITLNNLQKQKWFDIDPQRGAIDLNIWAEERMSWVQ